MECILSGHHQELYIMIQGDDVDGRMENGVSEDGQTV
jgi:hypothetical protein